MKAKKALNIKILKKTGKTEKLKPEKIAYSINEAFKASGTGTKRRAEILAQEIMEKIKTRFPALLVTSQNISDLVEESLLEQGYTNALEAFSKFQAEKALKREEPELTATAMTILQKRYLLKDEEKNVIETPRQMFKRVAKAIAKAENNYKSKKKIKEIEEQFFQAMNNLEFLPNSPTLMNAGTELGQLSACFALPVADSIKGIFQAIKEMALIHQSGGGTGFDFSHLRPKGDLVKSTKGTASGPVSFMKIFNTATEVIKQAGRRRGANMGLLRFDHPDILEFINAKTVKGELQNFNLSVAVNDEFMKKAEKGQRYDLINPRTKEKTGELNAKEVLDLIAQTAWQTGDPGLIFLDEINRKNPLPALGKLEAVNPCAEVALLPFESCNLGSINLARMTTKGKVDWEKLKETTRLGVRFLDNVIDVNKYTLPEIKEITQANRKIGLGIMGFAEMLLELKIPYDSNKALKQAADIMKFIQREARKMSAELARERGSFPNFKKSSWQKKYKQFRNATLTTIAPTGTISLIAGCSSGIEPLFALVYRREILGETRLLESSPEFKEALKKEKLYSQELMEKIAKKGSLKELKEIPAPLKKLFVTALDIDPEWHVKMQAEFQKHTDNAISKTVNLPFNASVDDVKKIFLTAFKLKCKGITVYRYGSLEAQVLSIGQPLTEKKNVCPECGREKHE